MLVKPILLTQNFQKYPRASVSQACHNLRAERANRHACDTLSARLPRQFPLARRGARIAASFDISIVIGLSLADMRREVKGQMAFYNITHHSRTIMQNCEMTLS
jgi:hypothetical protein